MKAAYRLWIPLAPRRLEEHVEGFAMELEALGYAPRSIKEQLLLMDHLASWLAAKELMTDALSDEVVRAFVAERRRTTMKLRSERALVPLLRYLRALGFAPAKVPEFPATPAEALLQRFGRFLESEKSLAPSTVRSYCSLVRPFVVAQAGRPGGWASLSPRDVDQFIVARASVDRPGSVGVRANALRALFRWMWRERLVDASLPGAVGRVAAPAATRVGQRAFEKEELVRLFGALSKDVAARRRDQAMLALLARLGLRAGEVASLRLDDLDWRAGVIRVRGKRGRVDELPLPSDVGAALGAYLKSARSSGTSHREVFLGVDAPHGPITGAAVTSVVIQARRRAGIDGRGGAHRLRHSAACAVLASGGGLTEVAQLLRHEHPSASARYARSNLEALATLARPWPAEVVR
jgi:site-specific recombinase XerD